jgi:hypothetical protein
VTIPLILPLFHDLSLAEQDLIVDVIKDALVAAGPVIGNSR